MGDVLGKYHPHGDSACYEAMVLMAQPFSYRYPLIDGQGNWGSYRQPQRPSPRCATPNPGFRPYAACCWQVENGDDRVGPNFDGTLREPVTAARQRSPTFCSTGATGIAVGMTTDILPHNIGEVVDACIHLIDHPKSGT